ncbi:MAG TPA: hypothetical protein VER55_07310 [Ardenticatenaceae bacterium]|nr:hypothetical protein [Ardenticatenaceae bacterium]
MAAATRATLRLGLLGGLAAWHVCLVGILQAFAERRLLGEYITLGYVLLAGVALAASYMAARSATGAGQALARGLVTGLIVGLAVSLLAWFVNTFDIRDIFISASPQLVEILTFDRGVPGGLVFPVLAGLLAGLVAAVLVLVPPFWRRIIVSGVIATLLLALLRDSLAPLLPRAYAARLFTSRGLTPLGAALSFVVTAVAVSAPSLRRQGPQEEVALATVRGRRMEPGRVILGLIVAAVLLTFPLWAKIALSNVADFVGFYILMGLGLNIVVGFAGLLDLGFVAFFAIGAYTMAILTSPDLGGRQLDFWQALPFAVLLAMLAGVLLGTPVLRMRGDYLAITTLGFGEIIRLLVQSEWLRPYLGGAQGITRIDQPVIGPIAINNPQNFYYLILAGCLFAWFVSSRLKTSRLGRAWMAIREDEDVAQAMGINRVSAKLTAFAIGAFLGGLSGALFASMITTVVASSFELLVSINVLALIIVGGMGSLPGVVVGALALVGLPELLREFREYRLLVYGAVLMAMMLFRPEGLWPEARRKRELHEDEIEPVPEEIPAAVTAATPPRHETVAPRG